MKLRLVIRMRFLGLLKKVGLVAGHTIPEVVKVVNPPVGAILSSVVNGILTAEARFGPKRGEEKKEFVLQALQMAGPLVLKVTEAATGRDIADDEMFAAGVSKLIDGVVDVMNSLRVLPKG